MRREPRLAGGEFQLDVRPVLARGLRNGALALEQHFRSRRIQARAVRRPPPGAVHLVGHSHLARLLGGNADRDRAHVPGAALQSGEIALERADLLVQLALLHLHTLDATERVAAPAPDRLDHLGDRFSVDRGRGLLRARGRRAQARDVLRRQLRGPGIDLETSPMRTPASDSTRTVCGSKFAGSPEISRRVMPGVIRAVRSIVALPG